jgi:hypothetical protein
MKRVFIYINILIFLVFFSFVLAHSSNRTPVGWHDGNVGIVTADPVNCKVFGWAYDPDGGNPINVHIYIGGPTGGNIPAIVVRADRSRPDVCNSVPGAPCNAGFEYSLPSQYYDGISRSIYVYGIDAQGGTNSLLMGSPKTLACQPSSPPPLQVSCSASPNPAKVGELVNFVSNVSGGSGNYIYSWSGACIGSSSSCMKTFSLIGNYDVFLTVTSGSQTRSTSCSVEVISNLPTVVTLPAVESL